ncbi:MAG: zinc ribbon-containing protein [Pseudomonadota bacterium]
MAPVTHEARHRLVEAYERMIERVHGLFQSSSPPRSTLAHWLGEAQERAVALEELTREEAERVGLYVKRDIQDAAHFLVETGEEIRQWWRFDLEMVEDRILEKFAAMADQSSLQLRQINTPGNLTELYYSGEISAPGRMACTACGKEVQFQRTTEIPACPRCFSQEFRRV